MAAMERTHAISELPTLHAVAVRLRDGGADERTIATALAIDDDEVPALLTIAEAKLTALMHNRITTGGALGHAG
jgi:hypothetical protein